MKLSIGTGAGRDHQTKLLIRMAPEGHSPTPIRKLERKIGPTRLNRIAADTHWLIVLIIGEPHLSGTGMHSH